MRTITRFVKSLLNDENGISQESYELLLQLEGEERQNYHNRYLVRATDGRFYYSEKEEKRLAQLERLNEG